MKAQPQSHEAMTKSPHRPTARRESMRWAIGGFVVGTLAATLYLLLGGDYFISVPRWASVAFYPGFVAGAKAYDWGLRVPLARVVGVMAVGVAYGALAGLACIAWRACFPNRRLPARNLLLAALYRWTARILGAALVFLVAIVTMDNGISISAIRPLSWDALIALALILMIIGILAGWRWELAGGILSLVGLCIGVVPLHNSPEGLSAFYFSLGLPGLLYTTSALLRRREDEVSSSNGFPASHKTSETN